MLIVDKLVIIRHTANIFAYFFPKV